MEAAINLSGTGHLVLATLHANNCAEALDRIINMFPRDQHHQIFLDLSQYLKAIMGQRLIPGKDGKRVAAVEVMLNTPHIAELVKKGDVVSIKEAIIQSGEQNIQSFDVAILGLYKQGRIGLEDALANADSRTNLQAKINFGEESKRGLFVRRQAAAKTLYASNTGPSTHTRFIAGPSSVCTSTVQPAQPPTAHAMNSSSET
jgi:twitching motility protein PilU